MEKDVLYIYADGGSRGNPGPAASAFAVFYNGQMIYSESRYLGRNTNNVAEYNCLLMGLNWLTKNCQKYNTKIIFRMDSELVIKQLLGDYKVKSEHLKPLYLKVKNIVSTIDQKIIFQNVPREKNKVADSLVNLELDNNEKK